MKSCWRKPNWSKSPDIKSLEYWDINGRLKGLVQPFGDVWYAGEVQSLHESGVVYSFVGLYLTQEQAQKAIETLRKIGVTLLGSKLE